MLDRGGCGAGAGDSTCPSDTEWIQCVFQRSIMECEEHHGMRTGPKCSPRKHHTHCVTALVVWDARIPSGALFCDTQHKQSNQHTSTAAAATSPLQPTHAYAYAAAATPRHVRLQVRTGGEQKVDATLPRPPTNPDIKGTPCVVVTSAEALVRSVSKSASNTSLGAPC